MSLPKVVNAIRRHKKFLISGHVDPEADAIGSQLAIASLIKRLGKDPTIIDQDSPPISCDFMPGIKSIILCKNLNKKVLKDIDCALIVDCPTLERTGKVAELITLDMEIVNIDHHVSNDYFGNVNWVDGKGAATGEMIFELFKRFGLKLSKDDAINIYSAILIDTGSFRYTNTSAKTHIVAAELIKNGLDTNFIYESLFEMKAFEVTHLLGRSLSTVERSDDGKIVWMWITREMLKKSGAELKDAENFIGFPRAVRGSKVALLFKETEEEGLIKVSIRGKDGVDVNKIAMKFGGGGHVAAAGFSIRASHREAEKRVLAEISKHV
ncbi:MAG: bifunctional oligoribonuclease/PAP phosphatase NrnA [Candidatus Omnitrophota bacterium]|jgi:phosphoesterase RecJ-like protein